MSEPEQSTLISVLVWIHKVLLVIFRECYLLFNGAHGKCMPSITDPILLESATSLAQKIRTRKLTSVEVMRAFIARIAEVNTDFKCVIDERFLEALEESKAADELIASGEFSEDELAIQKPFLGVPISTKACVMVKGLVLSSGLVCRQHIKSEKDADCIALFRKAGAIPFALTNVPECCMWWESYNNAHGRTSNAYDTNRTPGGSSGGEGCIQATAASPFGIGSDIGGSIRIPAIFNGIFGHKPSRYIVSNKGQFPENGPEAHAAFLTTGPMCRYATDLKPMMEVLADQNLEKLKLHEPVDLKKVRFFYQENDGGGLFISKVDKDITDALHKVIDHLRLNVKAEVTKVSVGQLKNAFDIWMANMNVKNYLYLDVQLANMKGKVNLWWELLKSIFRQSDFTFVILLAGLIERYGVKNGTPEYFKQVAAKEKLEKEFADMLGTDGVFLYPTHPTVAPYHTESIIRASNAGYTAIINILGLPATSIPLGLGSEGLPLGIQAIGGVNQDRLTLAVACELERVFGGWVRPE